MNCKNCGEEIPRQVDWCGEIRQLGIRQYCLICAPPRPGCAPGWPVERAWKANPIWKATETEFKDACSKAQSIREALLLLKQAAAGGAYPSFRKRAALLGVDISHFLGREWSKGKSFGSGVGRPLEDYLANKVGITSHILKLKLIAAGLKTYKCEICGLAEWCGKHLSLELDHKDGNTKNNVLDNLRILCPNCHSQTETFRRPKKSKEELLLMQIRREEAYDDALGRISKRASQIDARIVDETMPPVPQKQCACGKEISQKANQCKSCVSKSQPTHIDWPEDAKLAMLVNDYSILSVSKHLGVSDNAVRKHCLSRGIPIPPNYRKSMPAPGYDPG